MDLGELFGYLASLLVFIAFYMRRMLPLRIVALRAMWHSSVTPGLTGLRLFFFCTAHCCR